MNIASTICCFLNSYAQNAELIRRQSKHGISKEIDNALNKQNYPAEKCKIGFFERGYMKKHNGKRIRQKKLNGGAPWFYVLELPEHYCEGDVMPLSGESNQGGQKQKTEKHARKP